MDGQLPITVTPKKVDYKNVHPSVAELDDSHTLCVRNVKEWIKSNREKLVTERKNERLGIKGAEAKVRSISSYISVMQTYLETGSWNGLFYGENEDKQVQSVVMKRQHLAYDDEGNVKRTIGTWYCDIGQVWTKELEYMK
jgi:hypothetical protein